MSKAKVWTRRQREHQRAERASREDAARTAKARRRRRIVDAAFVVAVVAVFTIGGAIMNQAHTPAVLGMSAASGLVVAAAALAHRWLKPRLGRLTAVAAISLFGAAAFLVLVAAVPQCPESMTVGRCGSGDLANWALIGLLLPVVTTLTVGTPLTLARGTFRLVRYAVRTVRAHADH